MPLALVVMSGSKRRRRVAGVHARAGVLDARARPRRRRARPRTAHRAARRRRRAPRSRAGSRTPGGAAPGRRPPRAARRGPRRATRTPAAALRPRATAPPHRARARPRSRASGRSRIMSSRSETMPLATPSCSPMRSRCFCARSSSPTRGREDVERRLDDAERVAQLVADGADELPEGGEPLDARLLREQVLAVGVQHDGELEVEDLAAAPRARRASCVGSREVALVDDCVELAAGCTFIAPNM